MDISPQERETCLRVLQQISEDPSVIDHDERMKGLIAKIHTLGRKGKRRALKQEQTLFDRNLQAATQLVQNQEQRAAAAGFFPAFPHNGLGERGRSSEELVLTRPVICYVCKNPFTHVHWFYHLLCPLCSALNWEKRIQRAQLEGRIAFLTGGRIKIGYEIALRLLRDGAQVVMTSRFPRDAAKRFNAEVDFPEWSHRLRIFGLDLRDIAAVEAFAEQLDSALPYLDIVVHNAAQTVKRPLAFYQHLLDGENAINLPNTALQLVDGFASQELALLEQHALYPVDRAFDAYFPNGRLDADGQQFDGRPVNSWRAKLDEVSTLEMLEVQLVNAVAPFVLNAKLKPLFERSPHPRRFIVNVSAMEGQFGRRNKTCFHPHTNMAKAALNMMTRTCAADLATQGIYMNSVDTGWITDENPTPIASRTREMRGFYTPLDAIDGAARIYDPIAQGLNEPEEPLFGHFLKDYKPHAW